VANEWCETCGTYHEPQSRMACDRLAATRDRLAKPTRSTRLGKAIGTALQLLLAFAAAGAAANATHQAIVGVVVFVAAVVVIVWANRRP
jgi:hypothetical protein